MELPLQLCKKFIAILLVLFLFNLLFSCNPAAYVTQTPIVPLFKEKGDANIDYGFNMAGNPQNRDIGFGINTAYALTDHFVLTGSFYTNSGGEEVDTTQFDNGVIFLGNEWRVEHNIFGISAGWYNSGKGDINSNWRVEVLGGISYANLQNQREDNWLLNSKSLIYSVKPAIGYVSKNLTVYTSLKINYLDYLTYETRLPGQFALTNQFFDTYDGHFIVEPSIGVQLGIEPVKVGLHYAIGSFNENISIESLSGTSIVSNSMVSFVMVIRPRLKREK